MIYSKGFQYIGIALIFLALSAVSSPAQSLAKPTTLHDRVLQWNSTAIHAEPPQFRINPLERPSANSQAATPDKQRSITRKILGAAVGAAGGFFGGGYLGAAIEGDRCHCDDPGLMGFIIGAPVGAVTGGILGYKFLF